MSTASLTKSIRTSTVDPSYGVNLLSARYQTNNDLVCQTWNGTDDVGRSVCPYSYSLENAGCTNPCGRIAIENMQRPQYINFITLDAQGIQSNGYQYQTGGNQSLAYLASRRKSMADQHTREYAGHYDEARINTVNGAITPGTNTVFYRMRSMPPSAPPTPSAPAPAYLFQ